MYFNPPINHHLLHYRIQLKPLFSLIPDFESPKNVRPRKDNLIFDCGFKWQQSQQEYEHPVDSGEAKLDIVPAAAEVGSKIRVLAVLSDSCHEEVRGEEEKGGSDCWTYPLKERVVGAEDQRMRVMAALGGVEKCLVEMVWNATEKTLLVYPDFNKQDDNPYLIESDHGQMILYSISPLQKKKRAISYHHKLSKTSHRIESFDRPDRNHFTALLLFQFATAKGFDFDRVHFKYTIKHAATRTTHQSSTHTTQRNGDVHTISHSLEEVFQVPYEDTDWTTGDVIEVIVEAYSLDMWSRERYHGWSRLAIPTTTPGHFTKQMQFLREEGSYKEALERFFIGGHRRVHRESFAETTLYGQQMKASGSVNVTYNLVVQHNTMRNGCLRNREADVLELDQFERKGRIIKEDLDSVIESFKQKCALVE